MQVCMQNNFVSLCLLLFMQGYASISREPCITLQKTWSQSFEEGCFLKFALRVAPNVLQSES